MDTWADTFISQIREDLTEKITTLDEIWAIMIFSPERQSVAEAAARVAEKIIKEKDDLILELKTRISVLDEEAIDQQQELVRRREKIDELLQQLKLKTPICDNI
jgi:hypothetical protein